MNEDHLPFYDLHDQEAFLREKLCDALRVAGYDDATLTVKKSGTSLSVSCKRKNGTVQTLATVPSSADHLDLRGLPLEEKYRQTADMQAGSLASLIRMQLERQTEQKTIRARLRSWFTFHVEQNEKAKDVTVSDELFTNAHIREAYDAGRLTLSSRPLRMRSDDVIIVKKIRIGLDVDNIYFAQEKVNLALEKAFIRDQRVHLFEQSSSDAIHLHIYLVANPPKESPPYDFGLDANDIE